MDAFSRGENTHMSKTTQTLSVRIDPDVLAGIAKYLEKDRGATQAKVVESLISYFNRQSLEQQRLIVMGVGTDYLDLLGKALQLINWGDHATRGGFASWVIQSYATLDKISADAQSSMSNGDSGKELVGVLSMRRMAWFKLGSAWIGLARNLRTRALSDLKLSDAGELISEPSVEWPPLFGAAIGSLQVAIAYFRLFNKSQEEFDRPPDPRVLYNQACAWTLIAQYLTEQGADKDQLRRLAKQEKERLDTDAMRSGNPDICVLPFGIAEATGALQRAAQCLQSIAMGYESVDAPEGMPLGDVMWLIDYAEVDPDLACFRKMSSQSFAEWLAVRKTSVPLLKSYWSLKARLPKEVEALIESERSPA